jgi:transaldolase
MAPSVAYKSRLHEMTQSTATCLWNDSASIQELASSIEHGAVGATCNPVIVLEVLKKEMRLWKDRIQQLIREMPAGGEDEIAWKVVEEISAKAAGLLIPAFEQHRGRNGRLSVQTDSRFYRNPEAIVTQASHFAKLAPNIIVTIPVTSAGITAIEEALIEGLA